MRKKGIADVLFRSVMSLYEGAKTRVKVDTELSEDFQVKMWMHQRSVLSAFRFAVVDIVAELGRDDMLSELLYADDLLLMSEMF